MVRNVVEGLRAIHGSGVAHRDIKPDNILVHPRTGEIRYIDFGLACWEEGCEAARAPIGTQGFLAPEQTGDGTPPSDEASWQRADLYSLACTIWAMNRVYIDDVAPADRADLIRDTDRRLRTMNATIPGISPWLRVDPAKRPPLVPSNQRASKPDLLPSRAPK